MEKKVGREDFDRWLTEVAQEVPIVHWGPVHTDLAVRFANAVLADHRCGLAPSILEALNSDSGVYKP